MDVISGMRKRETVCMGDAQVWMNRGEVPCMFEYMGIRVLITL